MSSFDPSFERKARDLFLRLLEQPPVRRDSYLEGESIEPRLRRRTLELLRRADQEASVADPDGIPQRLGRFTIVALLGRSPTSTVYLARADDSEEPLALKILQPGFGSGEISQRFRREREILARLEHPGIARLVDHGKLVTDAGEFEYLVTRYIPGESLRDLARGESLDLDARFDLLDQMLESIGHAHERAVIHRDLKPENLMITPDGRVVVLDFGISRWLEAPEPGVTLPGQIVGTLRYMSPEQLASKEVEPSSDLFSIGMIAWELLAGEMPYEVPESSLYHSVVAVATSEPRQLPEALQTAYPGLEVFLLNALSKDLAERYADAERMREDLRRVRERLPVARLGETPHPGAPGRPRRRWGAIALASAALAAVLLLVPRWLTAPREPGGLDHESLREVTAASQFALAKLHFQKRTPEDTRAAIARLEAAHNRIADLPGRAQAVAWMLATRLGEAQLILAMLTADQHAYTASSTWYERAWRQESVTAGSLQELPTNWAIREHFREIGLHQPLVGLAASREGLAALRDSDRNLHLGLTASGRALERLAGPDSGCFPSGVPMRARREALAIARNDQARMYMRHGTYCEDREHLDLSLRRFTVLDSMTILQDRRQLAYASFLLGMGEAYYQRHRLSGKAADLDSARARLNRAEAQGGSPSHVSLYVETAALRARTEVALGRRGDAAEFEAVLGAQLARLHEVERTVSPIGRRLLRVELALAITDLEVLRAESTGDAGGLGRSEQRLERMLSDLPGKTHPAPRGEVLLRLAKIAELQGNRARALERLHQLRQIMPDIGRPNLLSSLKEAEDRLAS